MNKFWYAYICALLFLTGFTVSSVSFSGCSGFVNPFVDAEKAFKEDIKKDIKAIHAKFEAVEDRIKDFVSCACDPNRGCNCGDKPAQVVDQWFQSQEKENIYYYGHVVDGVLYYTYWYDSVTHQTYRVVTGNKSVLTTKNFKAQSVSSPK